MRALAGERFRSPQSHANQEHPPDLVRAGGSRGGDLRQHRRHSEILRVNAIERARMFFEAEGHTRRSLRTNLDDVEYVEKQTSSQARLPFFSRSLCPFFSHRHKFT